MSYKIEIALGKLPFNPNKAAEPVSPQYFSNDSFGYQFLEYLEGRERKKGAFFVTVPQLLLRVLDREDIIRVLDEKVVDIKFDTTFYELFSIRREAKGVSSYEIGS